MYKSSKFRGHFSSLYGGRGTNMVSTTITTQYKSKAKDREAEKREALLREIESITGTPAQRVARSLDGVNRRWCGVAANKAD
jgi:hypothetical protein